MKKMFFALAALVLAFTACTSENEVIDTPKKEVKVTVNMDKPGFGDDSRAPRRGWEEGDQVTVVLGGYFGAYVLAERAGTKLGQSEHVKFIEDNTVFKGTARYDGKPVIREAFAIFGLGKAPDTTSPKFAGEE